MSSFAHGFAQGFFGTLGEQSLRRQEAAENYFNKQVELARTRGVENRGKVKQAVDQSVSLAKQLQQMGVPRDIIMSVANQDPNELSSLYVTVSQARERGLPIDEGFFKDVVEVGGDFKAPNEDFNTFFRKIYEPLASNYQADPEGFKRDRKGSLLKTMLGYTAMEDAQAKLGRTEIMDGMTAEQLLAYGDEITPNKPYGESVVTYNTERVARTDKTDTKVSRADVEGVYSSYEDAVKTFNMTYSENVPEGRDPSERPPEEEVNRGVAELLYKKYAPVPHLFPVIERLTGVSYEDLQGESEEIAEETLPPSIDELRQAGIEGSTPETQPPAPQETQPDRNPIDIDDEPELLIVTTEDGRFYFHRDLGDGTAIYRDDAGNSHRMDIGEVRAFVRNQMAIRNGEEIQ